MPPGSASGKGPVLKLKAALETRRSRRSSESASISISNKPALAEARQESANRLQHAWQDIFDRYIHNDELGGHDDEYDLATLEVVHDAGFLQREETYEIGCFGLPGAMGQDDETSEEEDEEDTDKDDDGEDDEKQVIDVSSSEDEMGNWAHKIGEPAPSYFEQRRAQELSDRDMQSFLSWNATKAQAQRQREFSVLSRQLKQESVKPVSFQNTLSRWTLAARAESIKPSLSTAYTPPASVKPESISSSSSTILSRPQGINSSLRKTKPFYSTPSSSPSKPCSNASSSMGISAAVPMIGGNSIRTQAIACESDSSDDEVGIIDPPGSTPAASARPPAPHIKKREETVDICFAFMTPRQSRSSQTPFNRQSATVPTAPMYKLKPVVEVTMKRRPPVASTSKLPPISSLPKRSSPLKESRTFSPPPVILPPSPPASRSSQALTSPTHDGGKGKRKASPLLLSESESDKEVQDVMRDVGTEQPTMYVESSSEDEMALPDPLEPLRTPRRRVRSSISSSYSPSPSLSLTTPKTPIVQRHQHYFPDGPPVASTSSAPAKVRTNAKPRTSIDHTRRQAPATVRAKRVRSPSPIYKRGEEPWRIRKPLPLPTPPPSLPSSSRGSALSEDSDSDIFISPVLHTPKRQMRRHPRRLKSESEDASDTQTLASTETKGVFKDAPHILSDDDDDELLLLPTPSKTPSTIRKMSSSPTASTKSPASPPKRRSTPRKIRVKTPPDEDSDESDDPLGCW